MENKQETLQIGFTERCESSFIYLYKIRFLWVNVKTHVALEVQFFISCWNFPKTCINIIGYVHQVKVFFKLNYLFVEHACLPVI